MTDNLDPRDTEYAKVMVDALVGMIHAVHHDNPEQATAELSKLLAAIVAHRNSCRPDVALVEAVRRLEGGIVVHGGGYAWPEKGG